ncbi:hypothetical protein WJX81_007764 [Elliptochloris bilobata]|uniref:DUF218 domain-containing protein n=1 Tax=Elliptochloris bilobata TaxID=381761 RepID=A0AAW1QP67_9CHLO
MGIRGSGVAVLLLALSAGTFVDRQHQLILTRAFLPSNTTGDVGFVLGFALLSNGTPTATLRQRVAAGVELYRRGRLSSVVFSGGHPGGGLPANVSEAQAMEDLAVLFLNASAPARRAWFLEDASTSTRENAVLSLDVAQQHVVPELDRWRTAVVVTSRFHQLRSYLTFRCALRQRLPRARRPQVYLAHVPPTMWRGALPRFLDRLLWHCVLLREVLALLYYWARGWLC